MNAPTLRTNAFSLVEVVVAIGVISFAMVAILGVFPIGLNTGHSAQNETRAAQIAQSLFITLANQNFSSVTINQYDKTGNPGGSPVTFDLTSQNQPRSTFGANSRGEIFVPATTPGQAPQSYFSPPSQPADTVLVYLITMTFNTSPPGLDPSFGNQVTISVAWPAYAPTAKQTTRNFVRIISKY